MTRLLIESEKLGIPATVVVAFGFAKNAHTTGADEGVPVVRESTYNGPFELDSDENLRKNTEEILFPQIIEALTKPLDKSEYAVIEKPDPTKIMFRGTIDEVNKFYTDIGWSDGLAVVPPTIERVEEFLKYTDLPPHEEIVVVKPSWVRATPWNIAVNGVMAGCRPEYMPILIAMVEAMSFESRVYGSTHSFVPYLLVGGPIAEQLDIDHGQGLITHTTNKVIGRAMDLMVRNLFGFQIKELRMGSFGYVNPWVLAEDNEILDRIGWKSYQVEKGFDKNANTVSTGTSTFIGGNVIPANHNPEIIMQLIGYDIVNKKGFGTGIFGGRSRMICMGQTTARILADAGYTKKSVGDYLVKVSREITYTGTFSQVYGSFGAQYPPFEEQLVKNIKEAELDLLPPWFPEFPGSEKIYTTPCLRPGGAQILICGDRSRNKVQTLSGTLWRPIEIRLPANWDKLMADLGHQPLKSFYRK